MRGPGGMPKESSRGRSGQRSGSSRRNQSGSNSRRSRSRGGADSSRRAREVVLLPDLELPPSVCSDPYDVGCSRPMLDIEYREPPRTSFGVAVYTEFVCKLSFMAIIPLAPDYAKALGGKDVFATSVVAASAIVSGVMSFPLWWLHKRVALRTILLCWCVAEVTADVLYAIAGPLANRWLLLAARVVSGLFSGPLQMAIFLSRSTGLRHRSAFMVLSTSSVALGYVLGPLLTITFGRIWPRVTDEAPSFHGLGLNALTAPGWVLAPLSLLNIVLVWTLFEEPDRGSFEAESSGGGREEAPPVTFKSRCPLLALMVCLCGLFLTQMTFSAWYTFTTGQLVRYWGWSLDRVCGYFALLMLVLLCLSFLGSRIAVQVADRSGMIAYSLVATIGWAIIWYSDCEQWLYSLGSLIVLGSSELHRGFTWSLASKVCSPKYMQVVLAANVWVCMSGLGLGAVLGYMALERTLSITMFAGSACVAAATALSYPILVPYIL